jgi:hypothetical protein
VEDNPNSKGIAMTQDEIIEMWKNSGDLEILGMPYSKIEAFTKLVAEKEREACANICERTKADVITGNAVEAFNYATKYLAKLIRARGQA